MGGLAGDLPVVERRALVEERRFRRVEVFRGRILVERAAAERDDTTGEVADRKHHAVAEPIVGKRDVVAGDQQAGLHHVVRRNAERAQVLLESKTLGGRIADAELELRRRIEAAVGEIAARFCAGARRERRLEEFRGELDHVVQGAAAMLLRLRLFGHLRDREPGHAGETLDRFRKGHAFGVHHEAEDVAVLAGREVVIEALLIVDEERGRALLVEGREALPLAARLLELDAPTDDLRHREAGAQLVEELRRESHGDSLASPNYRGSAAPARPIAHAVTRRAGRCPGYPQVAQGLLPLCDHPTTYFSIDLIKEPI